MSDLKQVFVFIASPGDVPLPRDTVRRAIERINRLVAKQAGFLFEPIGWEDIPPGKSNRAQEVINSYVDKAQVFIGILHQRFGAPTGIAESGTEEEFLHMGKRWEKEDPKPTIWVYFKKIPADRLADPGPQLKRVLEFKQRIRPTDFYHDFDDESSLAKDIENALADWVQDHRLIPVPEKREPITKALRSEDADVVIFLAKHTSASLSDISKGLARSEGEVGASIGRLLSENLCAKTQEDRYALNGSTDAFISIAHHLLTESHHKSFLSSPYFHEMLEKRLTGILVSRQHCVMIQNDLAALRVLLKTSPSAVEFILFGDTTRFDNLADQVRKQGVVKRMEELAQKFATEAVLQYALRSWINDALDGRILGELDGKQIAGHIVRMNVSVAFKDKLAFDVSIILPAMFVRTSGRIEVGQMVSGPSELFIDQGTVLLILHEPALALAAFDRALSLQLPVDKRKVAVHNKGLALLRLKRFNEAIVCFDETLSIDPTLEEARKNKQATLDALQAAQKKDAD